MNPEVVEAIGAFGVHAPEVAEALKQAEALQENKVVSKGLYLELLTKNGSHDSVSQIVLIPAGVTTKGVEVPMMSLAREVNQWSPRAQWRFNRYNAPSDITNVAERISVVSSQVENFFARKIYYSSDNKMELRTKPFAVEITAEDYDSIRDYQTPNALIRRINKGRSACGLPEKVIL